MCGPTHNIVISVTGLVMPSQNPLCWSYKVTACSVPIPVAHAPWCLQDSCPQAQRRHAIYYLVSPFRSLEMELDWSQHSAECVCHVE